MKVANAFYAAFGCVTAGYTAGYSLSYGNSDGTSGFPGAGIGAGGAAGQGHSPQQLYVNNMGCSIQSGSDGGTGGSSVECLADLAPECLGEPAAMTCVPDATEPGAVLDLNLVLDWAPPPPQGAAGGTQPGTAPKYGGNNVLYGGNSERYVWPAGSTPYETVYSVCLTQFALVDPPVPLHWQMVVRRAGAVVANQSATWPYEAFADGDPSMFLGNMLVSVWGAQGEGADGTAPAMPASPPPPAAGTGTVCGPSSRGYLGSYAYMGAPSSGGEPTAGGGAPAELEIAVSWTPLAPRFPTFDSNMTFGLPNGTDGNFTIIREFTPLKFPPPASPSPSHSPSPSPSLAGGPDGAGDAPPPAGPAVGANVSVSYIIPRSYVEATGQWDFYRPTGSMSFVWASLSADSPTDISTYLPVCTRRGQTLDATYAAVACWNDPAVFMGNVIGYPLPPWLLAHRPNLTSALGTGAPPRYITDLQCARGSGCSGVLSDVCEDYALATCIPRASGYSVVLDLDAVVDWVTPSAPAAAAAAVAAASTASASSSSSSGLDPEVGTPDALGGAPPVFMGDNVVTGVDYERYMWPGSGASRRPYRTDYHVCVENFQVIDPTGPVRIDLVIRNGGRVVLDKTVVWNSSAISGPGGLFSVGYDGPPPQLQAPGRGQACNASTRGYLATYSYGGRVADGTYSTNWTAGSHDGLPPELEIVVGWSWAGEPAWGSSSPPPPLPLSPPPSGDGKTVLTFDRILPQQYQYSTHSWISYHGTPGALGFAFARAADYDLLYPICGAAGSKALSTLAAITCRASGYILGYDLPYWYVPRANLDMRSLRNPGPPKFVAGLQCNISEEEALSDLQGWLPPVGCNGTLVDACETGYALLSCLPDTRYHLGSAIFDLEAVVDWAPPASGSSSEGGSGPVLWSDNVAIAANYERYFWPAGSKPYITEYAVCVEWVRMVIPGGPMRVDLTIRQNGVTVLDKSVILGPSTMSRHLLEPIPAAGRGGAACNASSRAYLGSYAYTGPSSSNNNNNNSNSSGGAGGDAQGGGREGGAAGEAPLAPGSRDNAPPELEIVVAWSWAGAPRPPLPPRSPRPPSPPPSPRPSPPPRPPPSPPAPLITPPDDPPVRGMRGACGTAGQTPGWDANGACNPYPPACPYFMDMYYSKGMSVVYRLIRQLPNGSRSNGTAALTFNCSSGDASRPQLYIEFASPVTLSGSWGDALVLQQRNLSCGGGQADVWVDVGAKDRPGNYSFVFFHPADPAPCSGNVLYSGLPLWRQSPPLPPPPPPLPPGAPPPDPPVRGIRTPCGLVGEIPDWSANGVCSGIRYQCPSWLEMGKTDARFRLIRQLPDGSRSSGAAALTAYCSNPVYGSIQLYAEFSSPVTLSGEPGDALVLQQYNLSCSGWSQTLPVYWVDVAAVSQAGTLAFLYFDPVPPAPCNGNVLFDGLPPWRQSPLPPPSPPSALQAPPQPPPRPSPARQTSASPQSPPPPPSPGPPQPYHGDPSNNGTAPRNLARTAAAAYSSSYLSWWCAGGCQAAYVIDGDTSTDRQMLHTTPTDFNSWLSLDLGAPFLISAVRIWHRPDFLYRTQLSELRIGNTSIMTTADSASLQRNPLVWKQAAALSDSATYLTFDPPVVGRWVTYQNLVPNPRVDDEHVLQVRELEVFGAAQLPPRPPGGWVGGWVFIFAAAVVAPAFALAAIPAAATTAAPAFAFTQARALRKPRTEDIPEDTPATKPAITATHPSGPGQAAGFDWRHTLKLLQVDRPDRSE
ncbi:hypothetical protein HYH02_007034 [Chlamydomonas schloesseri]|uniref:Uncharacterized protein n=1 Tax=Chlamydomonas schloesseri TaxID=2026947 RepID=A0A835WJ09_9CHLO|nr:hypothetical protein HYH02_007034 [Chlamydomonas schloesseri]|eukprot:KAG2448006.1 hypothetical protein HYH02_007034 [Chlamydomonas schloesseri]